MIPYYSEFDTPKDISIFLRRKAYDRNQDSRCETSLSVDFYQRHQRLFKKLSSFYQLVASSYEQFYFLSSSFRFRYEEMEAICSFFSQKDEHFDSLQNIKNVVLNSSDLYQLLYDVLGLLNCLLDVDTHFLEFFYELKGLIKVALEELEQVNTIRLPLLPEGVKHPFPNAWMITPTGYIYNTGGKDGHKEGNLIYPYYAIIRPRLVNNRKISVCDYTEQIAAIKKRGYVTSSEFQNYTHLDYDLPMIWTPMIDHEKKRYETLMAMDDKAYSYFWKKMRDADTLPSLQRSYQTTLCTLVVGHLMAENALYQSFSRLNSSSKKAELIRKIESLAWKDFEDILVRFCGFHKVESCERKITTSSLCNVLDFKAYLDAGWTVYVVPKIVYDAVLDDVVLMDFDWGFLDPYLTELLNSYHGKGKILIRGKNL